MKTLVLGALVLSALVGCAETSESDAGRDAAEAASTCSTEAAIASGVSTKDLRWNGPVFNGLKVNGLKVNGPIVQGTVLQGIRLNGLKVNGPIVQGTVLQGVTLQGTQVGGVPTSLEGELLDGTTIPVFIDHIRENPDAANPDVVLYEVSYGSAHEPLCGVDATGAPKLATALANVWDERTGARTEASDKFTFACQGAALYKCVAAGYKPWKSAADAEYHQACTRMIRADYCGDGTSFTKDGTLIDMGDAAGIQKFETLSRPDFAFEASWGPNGATCVSKTRYPLTAIPQCLRDRMADSCDGSIGLTNRSATNNACLR